MKNRHVSELLARALDEELAEAERSAVLAHLATCEDCRRLREELAQTAALLSAQRSAVSVLRPLHSTGPTIRQLFVQAGLAVAALGAAVLVGNALYDYRSAETSAAAVARATAFPTSSLAAGATPTAPAAASPTSAASPSPSSIPIAVIVARPRAEQLPSGGAMYSDRYERFELVSLAGDTIGRHDVQGVAMGSPIYDGSAQVAYWRQTAAGGDKWDLVVWDVRSNAGRSVFSVTSERPNGEPVWFTGRGTLAVSVRSGATNTATGRLVVVDVPTATSRDLRKYGPEGPPVPVYADAQLVSGLRGTQYEVLDARTGDIRSREAITSYGQVGASRDGAVFGLVTRFEGAAGPLHLWRAEDAGRRIGAVEETDLSSPVFRPARTELFLVRGVEIRKLNYGSGAAAVVMIGGTETPTLVAFDDQGDYLLVRDGRGYHVLAARGETMSRVADADLRLAQGARPIGVVRR